MKVSLELSILNKAKRIRLGVIDMDISIKNDAQVLANDATLRHLSPRETQVKDLILLGFVNKEIAEKLHIEPRTIKFHAGRLYAKYGVHSRDALILLLTKVKNLVEEEPKIDFDKLEREGKH
jgi:DNA-binding NarL/FixJ family response regulator